MVAAGFAVVATDYAGLGTPGPHQYDNKVPQANDVVYSIPAAHAAVEHLGQKWVAIGHSQGGIAVWGVAELEARLQDPDYAGAISVAGDMNYEAYEAHDAQTFDPVTDLYWPFTAFGIKASYPAFDVARMLTPRVLSRYRDVTTKGCWYYAYASLKEIGRHRAVKQDWEKAPEVSRYNEARTNRFRVPCWFSRATMTSPWLSSTSRRASKKLAVGACPSNTSTTRASTTTLSCRIRPRSSSIGCTNA